MYYSVWVTELVLENAIQDELPGSGSVELPVRVLVMVLHGEATVPVPWDDVELVRVQGVGVEDLPEEFKSGGCLSFGRSVDRSDSEVLTSNLQIKAAQLALDESFER